MKQRGRRSIAAVEAGGAGAVALIERPEAPLDLTPDETDVWRGIVEAMPADWFPKETWPLLAQYCRHTVAARRVAQLIDGEASREDLDMGTFKDLLGLQAKETASLKALAASMRLSQQSAYNALSANTAKSKRTVKRPWED